MSDIQQRMADSLDLKRLRTERALLVEALRNARAFIATPSPNIRSKVQQRSYRKCLEGIDAALSKAGA